MLVVEYCKPTDGHASEENVITIIKVSVINLGTTEDTHDTKVKDWQNIDHILVEHV